MAYWLFRFADWLHALDNASQCIEYGDGPTKKAPWRCKFYDWAAERYG